MRLNAQVDPEEIEITLDDTSPPRLEGTFNAKIDAAGEPHDLD